MTIDWLGVASTLAFLRSYYPYFSNLFNTGFPVAHIWSLNVEEHCYVLLSLLALALSVLLQAKPQDTLLKRKAS